MPVTIYCYHIESVDMRSQKTHSSTSRALGILPRGPKSTPFQTVVVVVAACRLTIASYVMNGE